MIILQPWILQRPHVRGVSSIRPKNARLSVVLRVALTFVLFVTAWAGEAIAGSKPRLHPKSYGYFDFPTCVRYALVHSDEFLKNRIDIQVKSIDVKDANSELLPTLQLITRYYVTRAYSAGGGKLNVQLYMTEWNPYLAALKIKSFSILVDIAKTNHLAKIGENTAEMAKLFYGISLLDKVIRSHKEIAALQRKKLDYGKSLGEQGTVDELELRTLQNNLNREQIQIKRLKNEREEKITQLKRLIGYHPDYHLPLDTRDAVNQILRGFNGQNVTFAEIQANNPNLRMLAKREQLQSNLVTGTYVALLPRPVILFEDIQNQVDRTSGFNFAIGLDYTLWDGFKRVRDIKRQKLKALEAKVDRRGLSEKLYGAFKHLRGELGLSNETEAHAREEVALSELLEERAFMQYKSGEARYRDYVDARVRKVQARLEELKSSQARVVSLIELATIAGGLNRYNAAIRY